MFAPGNTIRNIEKKQQLLSTDGLSSHTVVEDDSNKLLKSDIIGLPYYVKGAAKSLHLHVQ